ncbi:hypothetical protein H70357_10495 [Paenibacillus sp. FSL H7-0357]|uniref:transcriptional regulator n=1 Tax=Paenibacillus sp. FSL H7-0357 TaxID=1536774 RepID=UPI0004F80669|nr:transcriptional regulator [Paenibacillus sp. FSL H7-0357]AIQ17040.1 hypothetical protein H70357_10495 [Paenibacillus sp. FSL H7-0357]
MNRYTKLLRKLIHDSNLSLSQISKLLQQKGLKTEKSYLSKLQNGKLSPASDQMNKALAEVLSSDPVELMAAAYREKIPPEVLKRLCTSA